MKKTLLAIALIGTVSSHAHAGFWDSLFGGSDEPEESKTIVETVKETATQAVTNTTQPQTEQASGLVSSATALLPALTSQLNVSEDQAKGGMGALLQMAQSNLSGDEFGQLSKSIPNMDTLLAAAPLLTGDGAAGKLTGALAKAGGLGESLGGAAQLASQFKSLGLSTGMIGKFASVIMGFFKGDGGTTALLQKGLGSVLGQ